MSKNPKLYYTAGELADLFELPKQTLLYYDKMGVLSPEFISENNYRHYSLKQYLILEVILNMRKLGIPISKIKEYLEENRFITTRALRLLFGLTQYTAQKWLKYFCEKGIMVKDGTRHSPIYFLK